MKIIRLLSSFAIWLFVIDTSHNGNIFVAVASAFVPSSTSKTSDEIFHNWCNSMGISINPSVRVITTEKSVAGRGIFAVEDIVAGEKIGIIPSYMFFHPANAGVMFPETAAALRRRCHRNRNILEEKYRGFLPEVTNGSCASESRKGWFGTLRQRLFRRRNQKEASATCRSRKIGPQEGDEEDINSDDNKIPWQVELTEYALEALKSEHPMAPWIQQWQRDDPVLHMFQKGVTLEDQKSVARTAIELREMVPNLASAKIMAALNIRLEEYQSFEPFFVSDPKASDILNMYNVCTSRTLGVTDDVTAVVPFHDMINHSFEPNVGLAISDDGRHLELFATSDVAAGNELFLCYSKYGKEYSETAAVWMLVQWGIPVVESEWKVIKQNNET